MPKSFIEQSKLNWVPVEEKVNLDQLQVGCLMRIATATEVMAQNYLKLQADRDMYQRWYSDEKGQKEKLFKRVSGLKGVITKMNKKK